MDPAWITAATGLSVVVIGALGWAVRWTWRILRRVIHLLDDYFGEPSHDGVPARPGVMARLASVEALLASVAAETKPNGGTSLRDDLTAIAADVASIKSDQSAMRHRIELFETRRTGREGQLWLK